MRFFAFVSLFVLSGCAVLSGLSSLDVGSDAGAPDAASDVAVSVDASDADARPRPCVDAGVELCDDFDTFKLGELWDPGASPDPKGKLELVTDRAVSPTHSLHSAMGPVSVGPAYAALTKTFAGAWRDVVVDAEMWLAKPNVTSPNKGAGLVTIYLASNKGAAGSVLFAGYDYVGQSIVSNEGNLSYSEGPPIPLDRWVHVHLEVRPSNKSIVLVLDQAKAEVIGVFPSPTVADNPRITVTVGLQAFDGPTDTLDVRFDDVKVDLQ